MLTRVLVVSALTLAAAGWYAALPPGATTLPPAPPGVMQPVRGAIHVHSLRSDGTADVEQIAAAAARAGLQFVVFTDHGDGVREPDPPRYVGGVLCIDAVEISTRQGHLIALGLPESPYPLGGDARDVVEDVGRLGGFAIAAHPTSAKPELQWRAWDVPVSGLEWLNADSEWRDESRWTLARAVVTYPGRRAETLVSLLDRPDEALRRWDDLTRSRRVVGIAAADAHARIGLRTLGEPYDNSSSLHVPSYEQMFRVFSNSLPGLALTGEGAVDGPAVIAAIRAGHVYSTIDALGGPAAFSFTASSGSVMATGGDVLPVSGPVNLRVEVQAPSDVSIAVVRDGSVVETRTGPLVELDAAPAPAVYRIEVSLPAAPGQPAVPWIVSNPIYVGRSDGDPAVADSRPRATTFAFQYQDGPANGWTVETSDASLGALDVVSNFMGTQLSLRYGLGGALSSSPFTAFVMPAGEELAKYTQLTFTGRADRPTRVSVQLRDPSGAGQRWYRSVYLAPEPREVTVYFDDMRPADPVSQPQPGLGGVQAVLFVMDTVNTPVGGNGTIWIDDVKYGR